MAKNQWVSAENEIGYDSPDSPDGGSWLYFGKDGKIVTAKWMSINGKTYYFDEDGLMQTGLLELDGPTTSARRMMAPEKPDGFCWKPSRKTQTMKISGAILTPKDA